MIEFIRNDETDELNFGGGKYRFDPGGRPSLGQAVLDGLGFGSAPKETALLGHALRGRSSVVCGEEASR
jgi:hypothetical protein